MEYTQGGVMMPLAFPSTPRSDADAVDSRSAFWEACAAGRLGAVRFLSEAMLGAESPWRGSTAVPGMGAGLPRRGLEQQQVRKMPSRPRS